MGTKACMQTNKKIKLLDFKLTKNLWASLFWVYKSKFTWTWIDFVKHKEYTWNEPIKNIDWKTLWKTDKVYSKVFEDERDLKVLFLIDIDKSIEFWIKNKKKKNILEELFYSIALSSSISWDSIWAYLFSSKWWKYIEYEKWFTNIFRILDQLDNFENNIWEIKNKLDNALWYILKSEIKNNLIFIITDETNIIDNKNLKLLTIWNEVIFFNIFDNFENNLLEENLSLTLVKNNNFINIDLSNTKKIEKYRNLRKEKLNYIWDFMKKNRISYKVFDTWWDTFKDLYLFFNKERNKTL